MASSIGSCGMCTRSELDRNAGVEGNPNKILVNDEKESKARPLVARPTAEQRPRELNEVVDQRPRNFFGSKGADRTGKGRVTHAICNSPNYHLCIVIVIVRSRSDLGQTAPIVKLLKYLCLYFLSNSTILADVIELPCRVSSAPRSASQTKIIFWAALAYKCTDEMRCSLFHVPPTP